MYSRAFQCAKCPKNGDESGCPMWWEIITENVISGEVKVAKDCGFRLLPQMMVEVIKATNRSTENSNHVANKLGGISVGIASLQSTLEVSGGAGSPRAIAEPTPEYNNRRPEPEGFITGPDGADVNPC